MEPERIDDLARALAPATSQRGRLKLAFNDLVSWLSRRHGADAEITLARSFACLPPNIICWDQCVNPQESTRHCGKCGGACIHGRCVNGSCAPIADPSEPPTNCRASRLRIWINAFVPGTMPGATDFALVDDHPRSTFEVRSVTPAVTARALTDRSPAELDPFSFDADARSLAHIETDIFLPDMRIDAPATIGGRLVQVSQQGVTATPLCARPVGKPFLDGGGADWWKPHASSADGTELRIEVDASWRVGRSLDAVAGCTIDQITLPTIRIKGTIKITYLDGTQSLDSDEAFVIVEFINHPDEEDGPGLVSAFPAFEMYAALDDGNLAPVFRQRQSARWEAIADLDLVPVSGNVATGRSVARFPCHCRGCASGKSCAPPSASSTAEICEELSGSFLLAGLSGAGCNGLRPDACPDTGLIVGDELIVQREIETSEGVSVEELYRNDTRGTQQLPAIGFTARTGDRIAVSARHSIGATRGISPFAIYRLDSPYRPLREVFRSDGAPFTQPDGDDALPFFTTRFENRSEPVSGGTICCEVGNAFPCIDHQSDPGNCGGCGRNCAEDQICIGGECHCPEPLVFHDDRCVDPMRTDTACGPLLENCAAHEPGLICVRSQCVLLPCDPNEHICDDRCVSNDSAQSCGTRCDPCPEPEHGQAICINGECRVSCDTDFHACFGRCVDNFSVEHCGPVSCEPCPDPGGGVIVACDGQQCVNTGPRTPDCGPGFQLCDGVCVSFLDMNHCGDCTTACNPEIEMCTRLGCCFNGSVICNETCVSIDFDDFNCGDCGITCQSGLNCCSGGCIDLSSNFSNCGSCGNGCALGEECSGGVCARIPDPPPPDCPPGSHPNPFGGCDPDFLGPEG